MKPRFSKSRPSPPPRNMSASWLPRPVAEDPRGTTRRPRRYADVARGGQCPEPSPASSRRRASLRGAVRAMQISKRLSLSFSSKASRSADNLDALAQHEELDAASPPQSPTTPPGDDPRDRDAVDFGRALVGDVPATERKSRSLVLMWLRTSQRTVSALGAAARFGRTISWGSGRGGSRSRGALRTDDFVGFRAGTGFRLGVAARLSGYPRGTPRRSRDPPSTTAPPAFQRCKDSAETVLERPRSGRQLCKGQQKRTAEIESAPAGTEVPRETSGRAATRSGVARGAGGARRVASAPLRAAAGRRGGARGRERVVAS